MGSSGINESTFFFFFFFFFSEMSLFYFLVKSDYKHFNDDLLLFFFSAFLLSLLRNHGSRLENSKGLHPLEIFLSIIVGVEVLVGLDPWLVDQVVPGGSGSHVLCVDT